MVQLNTIAILKKRKRKEEHHCYISCNQKSMPLPKLSLTMCVLKFSTNDFKSHRRILSTVTRFLLTLKILSLKVIFIAVKFQDSIYICKHYYFHMLNWSIQNAIHAHDFVIKASQTTILRDYKNQNCTHASDLQSKTIEQG